MSRIRLLYVPSALGLLLSLGLCCCGGGDGNNGGAGGVAGSGGSSAGSGGSSAGQGGSSGNTTGGSSSGSTTGGSAGDAGNAGTGGAGPVPGSFFDGQIAGGGLFGCAIDATKMLYCFGQGNDWDAKDLANVGRSWVGAGGRSFCSIGAAGAVKCVGDLKTSPAGAFTQVVVTDTDQGCGIKMDGSAACWGKLADTWTVPAGKYKWLAAGLGYVCGVHDTGSVECWGPSAPTTEIPSGSFERIYGKEDTSCAISATGAATCFGTRAVDLPKDLVVKQMAMGHSFECALLPSGSIQCFGMDTSVVGKEPKDTFSAIGTGSGIVCGFTTSHQLSCWGTVTAQPPATFVAP